MDTPTNKPAEQKRDRIPMQSLRVDEKGRIKIPPEIKEFLEASMSSPFIRRDGTVFEPTAEEKSGGSFQGYCTSFDGEVIQVMPWVVWRANEDLLDNYSDDPVLSESVNLLASAFGDTVSIDSADRMLLPQMIRREMRIYKEREDGPSTDQPNDTLFLLARGRTLFIYPRQIWNQRYEAARPISKAGMPSLRQMGLQ